MNSKRSDPATPTGPAAPAWPWLSATAAAAALGISPRAVQKRAAAGKIGARKIGGGAAARWEIDGRELDANREPKGANCEPKNANRFAPLSAFERETVREPDANREPVGREPRTEIEAELRAQLAREREFSAILKTQLEAVTQSEAQTKAALREALRAMPKQLPAATSAGDSSATPTDATGRDGGRKAAHDGLNEASAPQRPAGAQELTYNDIADQLERDLAARGL